MRIRPFDYIIDDLQRAVAQTPTLRIKGRVTQVIGTIIRAVVPAVKVGEMCLLRNPGEDFELQAEVVGFAGRGAADADRRHARHVPATEVIPTGRAHLVPVGAGLLGRVLDGIGRPLDEGARAARRPRRTIRSIADAPDPLTRRIIMQPLPLGVRVMDGLLTCGEGQRMGIFAGAGGGKSTLMVDARARAPTSTSPCWR